MSEVDISVILPVCHGGVFLEKALHSLNDIDFPKDRFEVVVVAHGEDSRSKLITEHWIANSPLQLKRIYTLEDARSKKLNEACRSASGRFLAFADDDCRFPHDWLCRLLAVFEARPDVGVVGGQDQLAEGATAFDLALDHVLNSFLGTGGLRKDRGLRVGEYYPKLWNMAIPRDVAFEVAPDAPDQKHMIFNKSLQVHEDVELVSRIKRQGKEVIFVPDILVFHHRNTTFTSFIRKNFRMARTSRTLGFHRLAHLCLVAFLFSIFLLFVPFIWLTELRFVSFSVMGLYSLILSTIGIAGAWQTRRLTVLALAPLLLSSLHLARGVGFIFPKYKKTEQDPSLQNVECQPRKESDGN